MKKWILIIVGLVLIAFIAYHEFKLRGITSQQEKTIAAEVQKQVTVIDQQRKKEENVYKQKLSDLSKQLSNLQAQQNIIGNQISAQEENIAKIKNTPLNQSDIDNLLNKYFNQSGVDPNR